MIDKLSKSQLSPRLDRSKESLRSKNRGEEVTPEAGNSSKMLSKEHISNVLAKNFGHEILEDKDFNKMRDWIYEKLSES